jgi:hypothetical protein
MREALHSRYAGHENRFELTPIQMPPMTFLSVVVTRKFLTTIRTTELGFTRVFYPNADLLRLQIEFHF